MDIGFSRMDQPSFLVHFVPGSDATRTGFRELFQPPEGEFGALMPIGLSADLLGGVDDPGIAGQGGKPSGFVT